MDGRSTIDRFLEKQAQKKSEKRWYITAKFTIEKLCVADITASSASEAKKLMEQQVKAGTLQCHSEELVNADFLQIVDISKSHTGGAPEVPAEPEGHNSARESQDAV